MTDILIFRENRDKVAHSYRLFCSFKRQGGEPVRRFLRKGTAELLKILSLFPVRRIPPHAMTNDT